MNAYKVYDLTAKKFRKVSYAFMIISEGYYPFRDKKQWPNAVDKEPTYFYPSTEALIDGDEWKKMKWDKELQDDFKEYCMDEPTELSDYCDPTPFAIVPHHYPASQEGTSQYFEVDLKKTGPEQLMHLIGSYLKQLTQ